MGREWCLFRPALGFLAMPQLREPSSTEIAAFLDRQRTLPVTYADVGATNSTPPAGWTVDRTRCRLGDGESAFSAACEALRRWEHYEIDWLRLIPTTPPLVAGEAAAILVRTFGVWWLNANRIMYVVNEPEAGRFGFAYGTLPGHAEAGEERFLVERLPDGSVWYEILAFSRPRHPLARLGYPAVRRLQKRFARDSAASIMRAVARRCTQLKPTAAASSD